MTIDDMKAAIAAWHKEAPEQARAEASGAVGADDIDADGNLWYVLPDEEGGGMEQVSDEDIRLFVDMTVSSHPSRFPDYDPTPWCTGCGSKTQTDCGCGAIAKNN
ncbi:MAG: hypothetical protein ACR2QC_01470 [Gammaproteobacteria bacterium]